MARTLCVWYPDWPLRRPDLPPGRPCQVVDAAGTVVAVTPDAYEAGARTGMLRREAEALVPTAVTLLADPAAETMAFEPVALALESVVPRLEVAVPGLAFLPVTGAMRFYGSEESLVDRVVKEVDAAAGGARFGLADGPFASRLAAGLAVDGPLIVEDTAGFLAGVDVSSLEVDQLVDTFRWLGVHTLGDLASLPRAAVASRFGPLGLGAHRVASGEDRAVAPRKIPEESGVEETFDPPLEDIERASFAARALAGRLTETFGAASPHRVDVEVEAASGEVRVRTWRSSHPFAELDLAERVRWQLRAWIESGGLPGGMVRLRMEPSDLSDRGRQLHLGQDLATEADAERALGRAQGLVGPDSVRQASLQGGRNPLEQVQWRRWGEDAIPQLDPASPWPGRLPSPSPALVPPQPQSFDIEWDAGFPVRVRLGSRWEPVLGWSGPWRSTGRWWEGEEAADRYQVVTSAGAFLCEIRQGRTFLVGVYD